MNEKQLVNYLKKQTKLVLIELLQYAYNEMNTNQRRTVFGGIIKQIPKSNIDGKQLLKQIKNFQKDSLAGEYYAPFEINSKNYTYIPEETEEWFEKLNDFLVASTQLSEQNDHSLAAECFSLLYDLIEKMEDGKEIIFADEYGSWMIPGDEKIYLKAFLTSLASIKNPKEFANASIPLIKRDSYMSVTDKVYFTAISVANKEQKAFLKEEVERQKIQTKSNY